MYNTLIVDDDIATLYMLKRFKSWMDLGFNIAGEACDGKEALQKLEEQQYQLVITDIKMPGMDGIEFLHELRQRNSEVCVIFLSTHSDFEYAKQGIRYGVFEYMTKPLEDKPFVEILQRTKAFLDRNNAEKEVKNTKNSLLDENSGVYYPKDQEELICNTLQTDGMHIEKVAASAFFEISTLCSDDLAKTRVLANTLLYNIKNKIESTFPWLSKIEGSEGFQSINNTKQIEVVQKEFISVLQKLDSKIQKYQLNHPDSIIRKICQFVIENVEKEISLEFIANEVHISKDYVGKVFKQKVLCNFNDYVTKVKMEHAKYLLLSGEYKTYEISERLNYKKTDYFSSLFKAYTGMTPTEFKKKSLN